MECSPPGSSVHEITQARILGWVAISFCRGSSWPRNRTHVPCTAGGFFTAEPLEKPQLCSCSSFCPRLHSHKAYCISCLLQWIATAVTSSGSYFSAPTLFTMMLVLATWHAVANGTRDVNWALGTACVLKFAISCCSWETWGHHYVNNPRLACFKVVKP